MRAWPGVFRRGLLILSLVFAACTGSPRSAQTSATGTTAPPIVTSSSSTSPEPVQTSSPSVPASRSSSTGPEQTSPSCTSQKRVPPEGTFSDVRGWIAFRCGSRIIAVDPAQPHQPLSLGPSHGADPIGWSRDGTRLLLRDRERAFYGGNLLVLDAGGSWTRLNTHDDAFWGSFSPDGNRVVYFQTVGRPSRLIVVIHADGEGGRRPVPHTGSAFGFVAWSLDGSLLAFPAPSAPPPSGEKGYVYVVHPDGTGLRKLAHQGLWTEYGGTDVGGITWSPDGSRLAFSVIDPRLSPRVYVVVADGSGLWTIKTDALFRWLAWSPDGSRIAFVRGGRLFTMAVDGSDVRRAEGVEVVGNERHPSGGIAWNPAG